LVHQSLLRLGVDQKKLGIDMRLIERILVTRFEKRATLALILNRLQNVKVVKPLFGYTDQVQFVSQACEVQACRHHVSKKAPFIDNMYASSTSAPAPSALVCKRL
jgi:hypothetical protein